MDGHVETDSGASQTNQELGLLTDMPYMNQTRTKGIGWVRLLSASSTNEEQRVLGGLLDYYYGLRRNRAHTVECCEE